MFNNKYLIFDSNTTYNIILGRNDNGVITIRHNGKTHKRVLHQYNTYSGQIKFLGNIYTCLLYWYKL